MPVNLAPESTLRLPPARLVADQSVKIQQDCDYERNRASGPARMKFEIELREHAFNPKPGCKPYERVLPIDDTIRIDECGFAVVESERREARTGSRVKWRCDYELDGDSLKSIAVSRLPRVFLRESKKPLEKSGRLVKHDVLVTVKAFDWRKTVDARLTTSKFIRRLPDKIRQAVGDAFVMDSPECRAIILRMENSIARCFRPLDQGALVRFNVSAATGRTFKVEMSHCVDRADLERCVINKVKETRFPLPTKPVCDVRYSVFVYNQNKTRSGKDTEIHNSYR